MKEKRVILFLNFNYFAPHIFKLKSPFFCVIQAEDDSYLKKIEQKLEN